jgi:hypothetical protein
MIGFNRSICHSLYGTPQVMKSPSVKMARPATGSPTSCGAAGTTWPAAIEHVLIPPMPPSAQQVRQTSRRRSRHARAPSLRALIASLRQIGDGAASQTCRATR